MQPYVEQHERDKERAANEKQAYEVRRFREPIGLTNPHQSSGLWSLSKGEDEPLAWTGCTKSHQYLNNMLPIF